MKRLWAEELESCGFSIWGLCGIPKSPVGLCMIPLAVLLNGLSLLKTSLIRGMVLAKPS
jgi:hypothetical protein